MSSLSDHTKKASLAARRRHGPHYPTSRKEWASWLAFIPLLATGVFYGLPADLQQSRLLQFFPQASACLALMLWVRGNSEVRARLGLRVAGLRQAVFWGCGTGVLLGLINTFVILIGVPAIGGEITFLRETPHAAVPTGFMVPWGILVIAVFVELNFRAFLLGRLEAIFCRSLNATHVGTVADGSVLAILLSTLVFAFDPFLVSTFRHLHWIAVWDGLIWGWLWVRLRSVYAVIVAHVIEVVIMYLGVKAALT